MSPVLIAADLVAIALLIAMFVPRHGRRDLIVSFLVVNVAVLAVAAALSVSTVAAGLGLGLFGVLSIIRLRSEELAQHEVAYYFAALSLGLIGGLSALTTAWAVGLMGMVLLALFIGDHAALTRRTTNSEIVLDRAYTDEVALRGRLESMLGSVGDISVRKVDLVNDSTLVAVRTATRRPRRWGSHARATDTSASHATTADAVQR